MFVNFVQKDCKSSAIMIQYMHTKQGVNCFLTFYSNNKEDFK